MKLLMRCFQLLLLAVLAIVMFGCGQGPTTQATIPNPAPVVSQPSNPSAPVLISIDSPTSATAGGAGFLLYVAGSGFKSSSIVLWKGSPRPTEQAGTNALSAQIAAADIAQSGIAKISVINPGVGTALPLTSGTLDFPIFSLHVASLSPPSILEGAGGSSIEVSGSGFLPASVVRWNGQPRPTTFSSASKLIVDVASSDLAQAGFATLVVQNPNVPDSNETYFVIQAAGLSTERISLSDAGQQVTLPSYAPTISHSGDIVSYGQGSATDGHSVIARNTCLHGGSGCVVANTLVSISDAGNPIAGNQSFDTPVMSADGRFIAFATSLYGTTPFPFADVGLRDTCLGAAGACSASTLLVGRVSPGPPFADTRGLPSLSADGRYIAFTVGTTDGYGFESAQAMVYDTCRGAIGTCTPKSYSEFPSDIGPIDYSFTAPQSISADGRYLAFAGYQEANIYVGGPTDVGVWVMDFCRGADPSCVPTTIRASFDLDGQPITGFLPAFAMSASARYVALVWNGTRILLRNTCIGAPAGCNPSTTRLSLTTTGSSVEAEVGDISISDDGRRIAFTLWRFDSYSQTTAADVFVRDTCLGVTGCVPKTFLVSSGLSGSFANGLSRSPMISGDGKYVVFQSDATDLVPGDTNNVTDIFRVALP